MQTTAQTETDADVGEQLFVSATAPEADRMNQIENTENMVDKPDGGVWTSTMQESGVSAWTKFLQGAGDTLVNGDEDVYKLTPKSDANVYVIDSRDDLMNLLDEYQRDDVESIFGNPDKAPIDYEAMADDYDGMRVTHKGARENDRLELALCMWDAESTIWFNWAFKSVEKVKEL